MISHTMPESPCTDTKIIPHFAFVTSYRRTVIFRLFLLRSETALRHRRSLKVDCHTSPGKVSATFRRNVNMFSSKMSRGDRGLGASDMKVYFQDRELGFSSPNWPLGQLTSLVRCSMCVDDLFPFYTVVLHTTGYIFLSTRKSISSIVWTTKKVKEAIRTTNN